MRMRVWWSLVLVAAVLVSTVAPSSARTTLRSPVFQVAAGCLAPKPTRELNLEAADRLNDMSGMTSAGAAVVGGLVAKAAVQQSLAAAAGETAAAAMAGESVLILGVATAGLGLAAAALWAGYYYYKELKNDPPDPHFTAIATPLVRSVALQPIPGLTAAETAALNALAANTRQLLAVTQALATTQNRASGALAARQPGLAQRQTDAAKQYAQQLAGLLDAQPALLARLRQVLAADDRFPAALQPSAAELRAFQSDVAAHGLPALLVHLLQEAGIDGPHLAEFRASIALVNPAVVAGLSYPGLLTDPQITAFDRRGAASWRQFAAGVCRAPGSSTPTPPAPQAGAFALTATSVTNPNAPELTINATGGTAIWDHPRDGGTWKVEFTFKVPRTLTPGQSFSITLGIKVDNQEPNNPNSYAIGARAPDFAQALNITAPATMQAAKTFAVPFSASYAATSIKDVSVVIGLLSAEVTYTYHRP